MALISPEQLLQQLSWRYATKRFDPAKKIPAPIWEQLEAALVLSPSSFGLQPWRFVVVNDSALRSKLSAVSWNQPQIEEASHLVVFMARRTINASDIDRHLAAIASVRGVTLDSLKAYGDVIRGFIAAPPSKFDPQAWAARQVYIALGLFLTSAASLGIDACPMEGIDPQAYDQLLPEHSADYRTIVIATAGYRSSTDSYASAPKVRFPRSEVLFHR